MHDPDQQIFRRFIFALGMLLAVGIGQTARADAEDPAATQAPVSAPTAAAPPLTGPEVYSNVCIACHVPPGFGGAPALGDGDAWAARIAKGMDVLIDHALHGFSGDAGIMPRKGGRVDLSDEEIIAAVEYMAGQATQ